MKSNVITKVDNIKYFQWLIIWKSTEKLSRGIDSNILNISKVASIVLHKLNSSLLFLPEFDMAINTTGNDEICPIDKIVFNKLVVIAHNR